MVWGGAIIYYFANTVVLQPDDDQHIFCFFGNLHGFHVKMKPEAIPQCINQCD